MEVPGIGPVRGALRRLLLGSGPLKRRSDRVQALGRLVVALALVAAPLLAVVTWTATAAHLDAAATAQAAERSPDRAVVLEDAPDTVAAGTGGYDAAAPVLVRTRAAWTAPDGSTREGSVLVPPSTRLGTVVPIWVDRDGDLTRPPLERSRIPSAATTVAVLVLVGVPFATWVLYVAVTSSLDSRRERQWEEEWTAVEPEWSRSL